MYAKENVVEQSNLSRFVARNPWLRIISTNSLAVPVAASNCVLRDLYYRSNYEIDIGLVELLFSLPFSFKKEDAISQLIAKFDFQSDEATSMVSDFEENRLILKENDPAVDLFHKTKSWRDYGWGGVQDYTASTFNFDYLSGAFEDRTKDKERMQRYREISSPPSPYKKMTGYEVIQLDGMPKAIMSGDLYDALMPDLDQDDGCGKKLTIEDLSALCFFPFGKTGQITFHNQGDFLLKCVPSGGARHPIECYLLSIDNEIPDGLYHYDVETHSLVALKRGIDMSELYSLLYEIPIKVKFNPRAIILLSFVFERSYWRYKEARSYRVIHNDVGHVVETVSLVSNLLGRQYYIGHGFHDSKLEKFCDLKDNEAFSYFIAVE
jgi:SagB-type dehydrogenase family enzyme